MRRLSKPHLWRCRGSKGSNVTAPAHVVEASTAGALTRRFSHAQTSLSGRLPDRYYEYAPRPGILASRQQHNLTLSDLDCHQVTRIHA